MDTPQLALIRQEWCSWHQRRFAINFRKYWNLISDKETKTLHACRKEGILIGLQAMHSRFISGQIIHTNLDPKELLLVNTDFIDYNIIDELSNDCGLPSDISGKIFQDLKNDLHTANIEVCKAKIANEIFEIPLNLTSLEETGDKYQIIYDPDKFIIEKWLIPIRNNTIWKDSKHNTIQRIPLYTLKGLRTFTSILTINKKHFEKLHFMYNEWLKKNDMVEVSSTNHLFLNLVYCLLARYETYSSGATGFQGSLTHNVFDALVRIFGVQTECFSSPLNSYLPNYYSAFEDTDKWFGSQGSFFRNFKPLTGAFSVNPPFVNEVMQETTLLLNKLLEQPEADLFFVVIIPSWTDSPCYENLLRCPFKRYTFQLLRDRHKYIDGMQHRNNKLFTANVD